MQPQQERIASLGRPLLVMYAPDDDAGGDDPDPTPYDLLLAALGVCTSMTMQLYARRKGWPPEAANVEPRHDRIHAADCESCAAGTGRLDRVKRTVTMRVISTTRNERRFSRLPTGARCTGR